MGQGGSKAESQFLPLWDCTGGSLDRGCSTQNDWKHDPTLLTILNTPPPRRKRSKYIKKSRSDSFSNEQYFITELKYRKDFISKVFNFYSNDKKRLYLSEVRELTIDVEDYAAADITNNIISKYNNEGSNAKSTGNGDIDNESCKINSNNNNDRCDINDKVLLHMLEKLGGQINDNDFLQSFVSKESFINHMFNAMNMKSFTEKQFDRIISTLCIKGEHKKNTKAREVKLILLQIWDAFDWNMDGRQSYEEFTAFAKTAFGNESTEEACKDMYMAMLPSVEEKNLDDHPGARLPDFLRWLWDSLCPMDEAEREQVLREFITIALKQPGAKKQILSNLL